MTSDDHLDTLLRTALVPTPEDRIRADSLVDAVLDAGADSHDGRRRRGWLVPAGAAAAALMMAVGVAMPSLLSSRDDESPAVHSAPHRHDGTEYVDVHAWLAEAFPTVSWKDTEFIRTPLVAVRSAPWCPACGGEEFMTRITASATAQPRTRFVVVAPGITVTELSRANDAAPPNVAVLAGDANTPLPGETPSESRATPALVRLSPLSAVTVTASGRDQVEAALVPPPAPQVVTIRCRDDGVEVDRDTIDAASDGVHVRIVNDSGSPIHPEFGSDAGQQPGERLLPVSTHRTEEWVTALPPGDTTVRCDGSRSAATTADGRRARATPAARLTVRDPEGYWRGTAADAGCPLGGRPSWAGGPGQGATPADAAATWPRFLPNGELPVAQRPGYTVRAVGIGYADGRHQFFVVDNAGRAETLLRAYRTDDGGLFEALPEWICRGAL